MFKTVFRKWLLTYVSIALLSILMISMAIGFALERKTYEKAEKELLKAADQVNQLSLEFIDGELTLKELQRQLRLMERSGNVQIVISSKGFRSSMNELLSTGEIPELAEWVKEVNSGRQQLVKGSFLTNYDTQMLVVGIPFVYKNVKRGAIFLYTPAENSKELVGEMYRTVFLVSLPAGFLAVALLYFASRRFVQPLVAMKEIAGKVALGQFGHRMRITGDDEIAQLSRSFNYMAERLDHIEQGRKQLIAEISHELRTPLTTIRASLQGVLDQVVDPQDEKAFLRISLDEAKRLGNLAQDLLELSRFEEKQVVLRKERICLSELLGQTVEQMKASARDKGMEIEACIEAEAYIEADADRLRQVFLNLLGNALVHAGSGAAVGITLAANGSAQATVWDQGPGIEQDKLPYIFQRFYKADDSRSSQGAGLGLTISKHIIEAHGGTIEAESTVGSGTRFIVTLPLCHKEDI